MSLDLYPLKINDSMKNEIEYELSLEESFKNLSIELKEEALMYIEYKLRDKKIDDILK